MRSRQMAVFLFLLGASWIVDYRRYATGTPEGLFILGGVLCFGCLLFNFGSMPAVLGAAVVGLAVLALDPHLSNHETLYIAVMVAILCAWIVAVAREKSFRVDVARYDATLAQLLRLVFLVSYVWAAFHKWNSDFLDPATSCAVHQIVEFQQRLPAIPVPSLLFTFGAPLTIAIELAIPFLLIVPRTRRIGVLLGLGFHTVLGIGFPAFQILVFGFLLLFVPEQVWQEVFERARERGSARLRSSWWWQSGWARAAIGAGVAIVSTEFVMFSRAPAYRSFLSQDVYAALALIALGAIALYCVVHVLRSPAWASATPVPLGRGLSPVLGFLPVAVFLQGLQPHLGFKSVQSFAMFSNLDTDGGQSNHWVIPASLQLSSNLAEPVVVHDSNIPNILALGSQSHLSRSVLRAGAPPRLRTSLLELRREVTQLARSGVQAVMVDYSHAGQRRRVENAELDPLLAQATLFERLYLKTRPIALTHHGACRW